MTNPTRSSNGTTRSKRTRALNPTRHGAHPDDVFIYGKTGVGKTAVTKYLLEVLETEVDEDPSVDSEVTTLLVNRQYSTTSYQALIALLNALRGPHDQVSATGHAPQDLYNMRWRELDQLGGTVLIALDEIDAIGGDDGLLVRRGSRSPGVDAALSRT